MGSRLSGSATAVGGGVELKPQEKESILQQALRQPELGYLELAYWMKDHAGFSVSGSSAYRLLKRHGLIHEVELVGFPMGKGIRGQDHTNEGVVEDDASYFFVAGWGWYYLISVLDDYSRFLWPGT